MAKKPKEVETEALESLESEALQEEAKPKYTGPATVAGYPYEITEKRADGTRVGIVTLQNGEVHEAHWDINGNDVLGGRPKFKIEGVEA